MKILPRTMGPLLLTVGIATACGLAFTSPANAAIAYSRAPATTAAAVRPLTDPPGTCLPEEEGQLKVDSETGEFYGCEYVQDPEFCAYLWVPWHPSFF